MQKKITKRDAIQELWNRGNLQYKLKGKQKELYKSFLDSTKKLNVICSSRRFGKCLKSDTYILTPTGMKQIVELKPGDEVYGYNPDGSISPCKVKRLLNNGPVEMWDLVHNGKVVETCSLDHTWLVENSYRDRQKKVRSKLVEKKVRDFTKNHDKIVRKFIKAPMGSINEPLAYTIGALLGDGCSKQRGSAICISGDDEEIVSQCALDLDVDYRKNPGNSYTWILGTKTGAYYNSIDFPLYEAWCKDRYAHEKIIDLELVKTWDRESQLRLLAGIIDTDGSVIATKKDNCLNIQIAMQALSVIEAVRYLIHQLFQFNPTIHKDDRSKYRNGPVYSISIKNNLFSKIILKELDQYIRVPRKKWKEKYELLKENNTCKAKVGVKIENPRILTGWDIEVDNETHMYCTANGLVTHNSTVLCILAVEQCLKKPNSIVKYAAPRKSQVEEILRHVMRPILEDCPANLRPEWKEAKKRYEFPNGSEIQIAATEQGHIESIRGGQADLAIVDEAGFASGLDYVVKNILVPAVATTKGKILLASTPNYEDPNHEFNVDYVIPEQLAGTLVKFTIHDAPMLDEEDIKETIAAYGGEDNPRYRCEFLCEVAIDPDAMVIGEFTPEKQLEIVQDLEKPPYFHTYVAMDIGFKDLTGVLFAYYDFLNARIVIEDEFVIHGPTLTTDFLAENIKAKEDVSFFNKNSSSVITPAQRVADNNNPILLNDLFRLHNLIFLPTAKDNKQAQINELKLRIKENRIMINPRCKNLIYHLKSAKWNKKRNDFERIKDNVAEGLRGGHADLLDALIYLVRNVQTTRNPYPDGYFALQGNDIHNGWGEGKVPESIKNFMNALVNKKK